MGYPLRKVLDVQFFQGSYTKVGQGRYRILLSCGHWVCRKKSVKIPIRIHCQKCQVRRVDCASGTIS